MSPQMTSIDCLPRATPSRPDQRAPVGAGNTRPRLAQRRERSPRTPWRQRHRRRRLRVRLLRRAQASRAPASPAGRPGASGPSGHIRRRRLVAGHRFVATSGGWVGAEGGDRTHTALTGHGILSPECLPVPPPRHRPHQGPPTVTGWYRYATGPATVRQVSRCQGIRGSMVRRRPLSRRYRRATQRCARSNSISARW